MSDQKKIQRRTFCKALGASALAPAVLSGRAHADIGVRRSVRRGIDVCEEIPSLCDLCFWRCGILAKVKQGRLVRIEGNPDHPRNKGRLCARGTGGRHLVEDPDRLRTPLLRTGDRGEGRWKPISWDQALDLWAEKMRATIDEHGPGAIGLFSHGLSSRFLSNFATHLGCPNNSAPSFGQCRGPRDVGFQLTFGDGPGSPARHDMARSRMIVLIGCHIGENVQTGQVMEFAEALGRGARLVVVDPRMSVAASKADRWLQIRPGTDTALLLAWIHILIAECLYDREYVERYTTGFDELREAIAPYRPEWAAEVTQIPREVIEAEARAMAERKPAVLIHCGRFAAWYGNDTQRARAMAILTALLGAWGRPGGYYMKSDVTLGPPPCPPPHEGMDRSVATGRHAFTHFGVAAQEIVEASIGRGARIRQWIFCAVNPAHSIPDFRRTREAMRSLDFITMIDMIPTEGALWADLILPEASYLERHDDVLAVVDHPRPFVALRQPVVQPVGQSKGLYWIVQKLAHRLGHDDCFTQPDVTGYLDARLAPLGLTCEQLAREGVHLLDEQQPFLAEGQDFRFETPSGRIELHSETMKSQGYQPLPTFEPVEQPPMGWFRLVSGRSPYHSFARTQNLPRLMEKDPENHLWLNQGVAEAKGLATGDEVFLQNEDGVRTGPIPLLVTPAIRTDVVYMVHGYGSRSRALGRAYASGVSDNVLTSRFRADGPTGGTGIRVNFVQLVTRDGREIPGEFEQCRLQRSSLPPVPEAVAPVEITPDTGAGSSEQKQEIKEVDDTPAEPPADNGFFSVKPEESC
ncbi:MAG: molybdopterin-dependent oxidoreductase [Deltaproteobacteria bacterium]|nr:molybdopterin-dependent oxidoreductase [Deltaproteobacteria bacterium]